MKNGFTFWERVQYAIERAAEDARYLPQPGQQELIIWHDFQDTTRGKDYYYLLKMRAQWLRPVSTIVYDERNFCTTGTGASLRICPLGENDEKATSANR
jgi:hypothetical protein